MVSAVCQNSRFVDYINYNFYLIKWILKGRITVSFWRGTLSVFCAENQELRSGQDNRSDFKWLNLLGMVITVMFWQIVNFRKEKLGD